MSTHTPQPIAPDRVPESVRSEVERRLANMGAEPAVDYITLEDFKREVAERRARRTSPRPLVSGA